MSDLWTPAGATYTGVAPVESNIGNRVVSHELKVEAKDRFGKTHKQIIRVLADSDTSQAEVEDMMGHATESFIKEVDVKYNKRPATNEERKQIGKALNEFLKYRTKRRESTTGKIYY